MSYGKSRRQSAWNDLTFSASAINPAGSVVAPVLDDTETGFPGTFLFSGAADNLLAGVAQFPHTWIEGSAVTPHIHVARTTNSANAMTWEFYYRRANPALGTFEAWQGPVAGTATPSASGTANVPFIYSFGDIDMSGHKVSTLMCWRVYRRGADAYADAARLFMVDFNLQNDTLGSGHPYTKRA